VISIDGRGTFSKLFFKRTFLVRSEVPYIDKFEKTEPHKQNPEKLEELRTRNGTLELELEVIIMTDGFQIFKKWEGSSDCLDDGRHHRLPLGSKSVDWINNLGEI
jgi:hypothetical protein